MPYTLDHFDAAGNLIDTRGRFADLASGRQAFDTAVRHRPQRHLCLRWGRARDRKTRAKPLTSPRQKSRGSQGHQVLVTDNLLVTHTSMPM